MKDRKIILIITGVFTFICFTFIVLPILNIFISVNFKYLLNALKDKEVRDALIISLKGALFACFLGILLGTPTAYFLSVAKFKKKSFLESIINLPIVIPHVAVGILLLKLLNDSTLLGKAFSKLGITFLDTIYGTIVAMCFVSISFIISSSLLGFKSLDRELLAIARSLGASNFQTIRHIISPLVFPYVLRGAILAFARSLSEVGALLIISYYPKTAPILMYERFENYGLQASTPITALIIFISFLIFIILFSVSKGRNYA